MSRVNIYINRVLAVCYTSEQRVQNPGAGAREEGLPDRRRNGYGDVLTRGYDNAEGAKCVCV